MKTEDKNREPGSGESDIRSDHPLVGSEEREELKERYYRVLHIADPKYAARFGSLFEADSAEFPELAAKNEGGCSILIYDVEARKVLCRALEFFEFKDITAFTWKG